MNRRQFLATATAATIGSTIRITDAAEAEATTMHVELLPDQKLGTIAADFTGLGYEISSPGQVGLMSAKNERMIQFIRTLGASGVIRVGGNTSDYAHWSADGAAVASPEGTIVNRAVINDLGDFCQAIKWKLIWGLNLGRGSAEEAAAEAKAVSESLRDSLLAFEIGNEPDLFAPAHRKRGYKYADFLNDYRAFKKVIRQAVPDAPFAGPDVANQTAWVESFAKDEGSDLKLLTHHHYSQGPPERPTTTIENLLAGKTNLQKRLDTIGAASKSSGVPYRFCEVNSCFHGGKAGVSDTFASALWVLDLMFTLASSNCAGVNIETGMNQLGRISDYSPIYPVGDNGYVARPIYYGMLAFRENLGCERLAVKFDAGNLNVKVYAVSASHGIRLTLINKELIRAAEIQLKAGQNVHGALINRLQAPSAASKDGVTFAGKSVDVDGKFAAGTPDVMASSDGNFRIALPPTSAAVVLLPK
jgi:hypothetical protein